MEPKSSIFALKNAICDGVNFCVIATDTKGVIQVFNAAAEKMLGYSAGEVINKLSLSEISVPEEIISHANSNSVEVAKQIPSEFRAFSYKASQGIKDNFMLKFKRKNGIHLQAFVSITSLKDDQSKIIGYLLIVTDNSEGVQIADQPLLLDEQLSNQQFYTRSLIESNIDALMATDPLGTITDVNKQMELLTNCSREELIGTPFKNYFSDHDRAEAGIKLVLSEKKVRDYELTAHAKDGKETVVSYNASTFYDQNGILQGVFAAARDITKRKQAEQQILNLALHDPLTQLPNRRMLNDRLSQAMASSKRSGQYGALIFLDLDLFKSLNDTYGHNTGDLLLIEVAHRISSCVREVDIVARFGGDEFVVILGNLGTEISESTSQANIVAEKIRTLLKSPYLLKIETADKVSKLIEHHCTSSIGVALFLDHEVSTDEVIKWADMAMYKAKESGGNSIHFYGLETAS